MKSLISALRIELLKARRSKVPLLTAVGFSLAPIAGGLFMIILKDPERARSMGLIGTKAQLTVGAADWPAYFGVLLQATAIGGLVLFSIIAAWIFGREYSDHTVKELMATPTPRWIIVTAKFLLAALWIAGLSLMIFIMGLIIGSLVKIPGWSFELAGTGFLSLMGTAFLTFMLMPFVAFFAGIGRGYLLPLGWAFLTLILAQIAGALGWGGLFPWSVPALFSGAAGPRTEVLGTAGYLIIFLTFAAGLLATFLWWLKADQTR